jgi:hypothetical protein
MKESPKLLSLSAGSGVFAWHCWSGILRTPPAGVLYALR